MKDAINVRCTEEEKEAWNRKAKAVGMNLSDWIRTLAAGGAVTPDKDGPVICKCGIKYTGEKCPRCERNRKWGSPVEEEANVSSD